MSKPGSKVDIGNALVHLTQDPVTHHVWAVVAADRYKDTGAAYIDFEFLQNTLTKTAGGGFSSAGPDCGRTKNDFLLQLSLGGSSAGFAVERWTSSASATCGFTYVDVTAVLPAGSVFAALNSGTVTAPYNVTPGISPAVFTYAANTFVEGAVDLSALISGFDPCLSIGIKTIMIKTKASPAPTPTWATSWSRNSLA